MMRTVTDDGFRRQLLRWGLRGVFCAGPSFYLALIMDFRHSSEQLAMILGVATYVFLFSWICVSPAYRAWTETNEFDRALSAGANMRAIVAPLMLFGPDMWCGFASLMAVERAAGFFGVASLPLANSFGWTYAATLLQGGLISATMLGLTLGLWIARLGWRWLRRVNRVATAH